MYRVLLIPNGCERQSPLSGYIVAKFYLSFCLYFHYCCSISLKHNIIRSYPLSQDTWVQMWAYPKLELVDRSTAASSAVLEKPECWCSYTSDVEEILKLKTSKMVSQSKLHEKVNNRQGINRWCATGSMIQYFIGLEMKMGESRLI